MMELVAFTTLVVFVICVAVALAKKGAESFKKRFPPISDAEFVARCTSGTDPAVALKVRKIVSDSLGVEYERIYPSSRFVDDLGAE